MRSAHSFCICLHRIAADNYLSTFYNTVDILHTVSKRPKFLFLLRPSIHNSFKTKLSTSVNTTLVSFLPA
ncbi:hypothetical protein KQX54_001050 [Cotesia glomerata]|uniref:Uncharacterized protein n=1 Tax=Cotesia glomerata TaxID=32391 RepID=A0AAV7ITZ7_COTGL|nr:hypothetical protein KQX54_001050 [Cotesia glomerata]